MNISFMRYPAKDRWGRALHVIFRYEKRGKPALGFVVKHVSTRTFTERNGGWRSLKLGPIYVRTFKRLPI